ncbi:MAG: glutamate racemase [Cyanobacteria bacterium]|nr:glutamate racemase [Cyanobacteriota bacterium]
MTEAFELFSSLSTSSEPITDLRRQPIGVFDSGVGGLTVLRELYRQLPQESLLYLADTARLPYGTKSPEEIIQFSREILTWMVQQQVKMVVFACNTSSAIALDVVRSEFEVPVLGLILPAVKAALREGKRIGTIATIPTAQSHAYRQAAAEMDPTARLWEVGCPEFVPIVEGDRIDAPETVEIARSYLNPLLDRQIDTLIYGCTHYPHLASVIEPLLPPGVRCIDPAVHVVEAAAKELGILNLRNSYPPLPTRFCVTGDRHAFEERAARWLGCQPQVERVVLPEFDRTPA